MIIVIGGTRTQSCSDEWPVSYHGTGEHNGRSIAKEGYNLSLGKRNKFGRGIYSTPSIEIASSFAEAFEHKGSLYKLVIQNRVCKTGMKTFSKKVTNHGDYWVQPDDKKIRPYGFCFKKIR